MKETDISVKQNREARIKKEISRLEKLLKAKCKDAPPKLKTAQRLIENTAFMAVHLEDLRDEINRNGCTESYQNGENQKGMKKSAAFDAYTSTIKNYLAAIKQLIDIAPDGVEEDDLAKVIRGGGL